MTDSVTISVKLFAALRKYTPQGSTDGIPLSLPAGATVQDAVDMLNIPREQAAMLVVGNTYVEVGTVLENGLELSIFPPLAGGGCG
jgi:molybdopterin converting factor small subunit